MCYIYSIIQIPDTLAGELHKAVAMAISKGVAMRDAMAETLRLPLLMLQALQPEAFGHFEAFVAWQQTVCDMLVTLYTNAANQWQALEAGGRPSKQARHFLARCVFVLLGCVVLCWAINLAREGFAAPVVLLSTCPMSVMWFPYGARRAGSQTCV